MSIRLFDIAFTPGRAADLLRLAAAHPPTRPRLIVTANLDHVVTLADNAAFREAYDAAVARTLDGMPLVWLARLRGAREVVRVTGHDLIAAAMAAPWPAGQRIFLVCAIPAVGDYFVERLVAAGLERDAVAVTVPPFGFEEDEGLRRATRRGHPPARHHAARPRRRCAAFRDLGHPPGGGPGRAGGPRGRGSPERRRRPRAARTPLHAVHREWNGSSGSCTRRDGCSAATSCAPGVCWGSRSGPCATGGARPWSPASRDAAAPGSS